MAGSKKNANTGKTSCERFIEENPEILGGFTVTIVGDEDIKLRVKACRGTLRILTFFERDKSTGGARTPIADTPGVTDQWVDISLHALNSVQPGQNYVLTWVIDSPVDDWQLVSEFSLNGTVHYRHLKRNRLGVINAEVLFVKVRP
ncbi:MAG TPA: hypothetical protein VE046_01740 [Steroidobacteraceae bacterium]|nr:hypothetical protein [Steroidobacteraceae bacterium]